MIYELRVYECYGGRLPALHERFSRHTLSLFDRHGIRSVGYWTTDVGGSSNELTYLLAFEDQGQRELAWRAFKADPEWQRVKAESERDGLLVRAIHNQILVPTDYSPLR